MDSDFTPIMYSINSVIMTICIVMQVVGMWWMFKKVNEKKWKSVIPGYNFYVMFKIFWKPLYFWLSLGGICLYGLLSLVTTFMRALNQNLLLSAMQDNISQALLFSIFNLFAVIMNVAVFVLVFIWVLKLYHKVSLCFGHGWPFSLGLLFIGGPFFLMLGLNRDKYLGRIYENKKLFVKSDFSFKEAFRAIKKFPNFINRAKKYFRGLQEKSKHSNKYKGMKKNEK